MFLLIDKPKGITSHDVVDYVRKVTGEKRVGHGGTLDPNATGLMVVAIGRVSTKKLSSILLGADKTYEAEIVLGEERETDDTEGMLRLTSFAQHDKSGEKIIPTLSNIKAVLGDFKGKQMQAPPVYSAKKIKGKPAYKLARKGEIVTLKPKEIEVYSIKFLHYDYPVLRIETKVSSGTYIRSLARDVGRKLGTGAYLENLRRTIVGKLSVSDSVKLNVLDKSNWRNYSTNLGEK